MNCGTSGLFPISSPHFILGVMKQIWKFPLKVADLQTISMPVDTKLLSVQSQNGIMCLWALVDPQHPRSEFRAIRIFGTGLKCDVAPDRFIGTVQIGQFVWHVFDGGVL